MLVAWWHIENRASVSLVGVSSTHRRMCEASWQIERGHWVQPLTLSTSSQNLWRFMTDCTLPWPPPFDWRVKPIHNISHFLSHLKVLATLTINKQYISHIYITHITSHIHNIQKLLMPLHNHFHFPFASPVPIPIVNSKLQTEIQCLMPVMGISAFSVAHLGIFAFSFPVNAEKQTPCYAAMMMMM